MCIYTYILLVFVHLHIYTWTHMYVYLVFVTAEWTKLLFKKPGTLFPQAHNMNQEVPLQVSL